MKKKEKPAIDNNLILLLKKKIQKESNQNQNHILKLNKLT